MRSKVLATLSETFWLLVLGVVVMFAFFAALGAFEVGEAIGVTIAVVVLAGLWLAHAMWVARHTTGAIPRPSEPANGAASELDPELQRILDAMLPRTARPRTRCPWSRRAPRTSPRPSTSRARAGRWRACVTHGRRRPVRVYEPEDARGTSPTCTAAAG